VSDKPRAAFLDFIKPYTDQSVVGIPRALVMLMRGDWTAAAMLNQILYWCGVSTDPENWFYRTNDAWQNELCLTANQLKRYKALLADFGVETKLKKANGVPTTHYRINEEKLQEAATPILVKLQKGGIAAIAGNPQMRRTGSLQLPATGSIEPSVEPSNGIAAIADIPLTEITSENKQQRLHTEGDRGRVDSAPPQADQVTDHDKMLDKPSAEDTLQPDTDGITMQSEDARQELTGTYEANTAPRSDAPPTIPYGFQGYICAGDNFQQHLVVTGGARPICGSSCSHGYAASIASETGRVICPECDKLATMIAALVTACSLDTKMHYGKLKDMALQLNGAGYSPDDVTRWRTKCWPDHWKAKKDQPIPRLTDVWEDISKVRVLPADSAPTSESEFNPYLQDEYFKRRRDDDDPVDRFVKDEELPPRNIQPFANPDHAKQSWFATKGQLEVQLNRATFDTWIRPIEAIGYADETTMVLEANNAYIAEWFHRHIEHSTLETFNRIDQRGGKHKKPLMSFVVVIKGDDQYRDAIGRAS
jgi:hypothetical protein